MCRAGGRRCEECSFGPRRNAYQRAMRAAKRAEHTGAVAVLGGPRPGRPSKAVNGTIVAYDPVMQQAVAWSDGVFAGNRALVERARSICTDHYDQRTACAALGQVAKGVILGGDVPQGVSDKTKNAMVIATEIEGEHKLRERLRAPNAAIVADKIAKEALSWPTGQAVLVVSSRHDRTAPRPLQPGPPEALATLLSLPVTTRQAVSATSSSWDPKVRVIEVPLPLPIYANLCRRSSPDAVGVLGQRLLAEWLFSDRSLAKPGPIGARVATVSVIVGTEMHMALKARAVENGLTLSEAGRCLLVRWLTDSPSQGSVGHVAGEGGDGVA